MAESADLTFVHLSDIHFRKGRVGTKHDPDEELRKGLVSDLRALAPGLGPINGIIVTGDIAWGGHRREYQHAETWIRSIAEHLRCPLSQIMVTPGNHDVYRPELEKKDKRIAKLQRRVRNGRNPSITVERLTSALSGPQGHLLVAPLRAYNRFAKQFDCNVSPGNPYWERRFKLGTGATLVIRGLTSTWLSGPNDSEQIPQLLYGSAQYTFAKTDLVHYVVAGHHPPQNMIDGEVASRAFDFHCLLQLFGHKHDQWTTSSGKSVKIVSGALHPDRREKPWVPRYNIVELSGELTEQTTQITIRIYPRRWSDEFRQFMADYTPSAAPDRKHELFSR